MSFLQRIANHTNTEPSDLNRAITSSPDGLVLLALSFFTPRNTPLNDLVSSSGPLSAGLACQKLKTKFISSIQGLGNRDSYFKKASIIAEQISTLCKIDIFVFKKTMGLSLHSADSKLIKTWADLIKGVYDLTDFKEILIIKKAFFEQPAELQPQNASMPVVFLKVVVVVANKVFQVFNVLLGVSDLALKYNKTMGLSSLRVKWINNIAFPVMAVSATVSMVAGFIPNYKGVTLV
jgi:hypothetical protein